jgi:hypothetical protein
MTVPYIQDKSRSGMEKKVEELLLDIWTSFARTGYVFVGFYCSFNDDIDI